MDIFSCSTLLQAVLHGVTVDVISIIGSECNIENLSLVTEPTGGSVERVDPAALIGKSGEENSNIMAALLGRRLLNLSVAIYFSSTTFLKEPSEIKRINS